MKINNISYWDKRFETNWKIYGGPKQTTFFTKQLLKEIPQWIIKEIYDKKLTIFDLGCAQGDSLTLINKTFPLSKIFGFDFSGIAINQAKQKYPQFNFEQKDIAKLSNRMDVSLISNTLEHITNYNKILNKISKLTDNYLIIMVPFQEQKPHKEHINIFDYSSFKLKLNDLYLIFASIVDCENINNSFWPGKQLILVYSKINSLNLSKIELFPLFHTKNCESLSNKLTIRKNLSQSKTNS